MKLTPGKLAGLKAVSDERGVIAAAAMDQRRSLKKSLTLESGKADLPDSALVEFKELVTEVLTQFASAILHGERTGEIEGAVSRVEQKLGRAVKK